MLDTPSPTSTSLSGTIERIIFHNPSNGFCVLQVKNLETNDFLTVVGMAKSVNAGESLEAEGQWIEDKTYGTQFKAEKLKLSLPDEQLNTERFLATGVLNGVGPHYASLLVKAFGNQIFEVLDKTPERLNEVSGLGRKRCQVILESWEARKSEHQIMIFLHGLGFGTGRAAKIYRLYGNHSISKITQDPYCLMLDLPGVGFKTADEIAAKLGLSKDAPPRVQAAVRQVLLDCSEAGHCAMKEEELSHKVLELLNIPLPLILTAIEDEITATHLVREATEEGNLIFIDAIFEAELDVAHHLKRLMAAPLPWKKFNSKKALSLLQKESDLTLSASQAEAVKAAIQSKVFIITGGPGVGKTTVVKVLLELLHQQTRRVALCAPTGRAAKRLSEATRLEAKTIHRLLEFSPQTNQFTYHADNPLRADLVIVDEVSMLDISLMEELLAAIPSNAVLILIGDVDQLPSVGPGAVLADLIATDIIPTAYLKEIFRQDKNSHIILNAHRINQGEMPLLTEKEQLSDFYFIKMNSPEAIYDTVLKLVTERIPQRFGFDPVRDIQVLTPMNKGRVGSLLLNTGLQKIINGHEQTRVQRSNFSLALNDKVMQLVNNYEKDVFNGDLGTIVDISSKGTVTIDFDNRLLEYPANELSEISLAYALSIHKSQGSEYPAVVIAITEQHQRMLERNLLYTAVTRGKELVVIVGQERALAMAVNTIQTGKRLTRLPFRMIF